MDPIMVQWGMKLIELAPALAVLVYITYRQEMRLAKLEETILELLRSERIGMDEDTDPR